MNPRIEIITGESTELEQLFQFIRELNEHHDNMGPFFHITLDSLAEDFHSKLFTAAFLYVDDEKDPVGFLLFSVFYRQVESIGMDKSPVPLRGYYLDQYYVVPQWRKQGLGTFLMEWFCHWIRENVIQSSDEISGGSFTIIYHSDDRLHAHYEGLGFENFTATGPKVHLYEVCGVKNVKCLLNTDVEDEEDILCEIKEWNSTCEQITLISRQDSSRRMTFLNQLVHTAWMGKAQWLNELEGDVSLLKASILLKLVQSSWKKFNLPLHCVWIECPSGQMANDLYQQTLSTLDFENITETEDWNFSILSPDRVKKLAQSYETKIMRTEN